MASDMPRSEINHEISISMKEHSAPTPKEDHKALLQLDEEEKDRFESGSNALLLMTSLGCATFSVVATQCLAWYSKKSTHIKPISAGQIAVFMVFIFFMTMFSVINLVAVALAMNCSNFWQAFKLQKSRFLSEENMKYVTASAEFSVLLLYFYICDRTDLFERGDKHFDRDQYWFIWVGLLAVGMYSMKKAHNVPPSGHLAPLQREQTEEWKGWMQIQFLMYHYFHAADYYNSIRCYIAAYVWMTGFGNFSFYYVKRDFGIQRFFAMQWRLNFFVFWCCLLLQNDYMLYYICMLHTTFTVIIYAALGLGNSINYTNQGISVKIAVVTAIVAVIWNVPGVFDLVWAPLRFLVDYQGSLHEWAFRSKLDHLVWIPGMLTAYSHPNCDKFLESLDTKPAMIQYPVKAVIVAICLFLGYLWYSSVFLLPKLQYNQMHPYTSFIPITIYIVLRNISTVLRQYHMAFFAWMGKITLETYICQFHLWMLTTGPNGSPKKLLLLLPSTWPLVNFALVSAIYVLVSNRIFHTTNILKNAAIPSGKDGVFKLKRNLVTWPLVGISIYLLAFLMHLLS